jgi:hypothetical protein
MRGVRRASVLKTLQEQLKLGTKTKKGTVDEKVPLTEKDTKRIQREIEILKERV